MKILVRGDCCSRRAFMLNRKKFDFAYQIVSNEKAPNAVFVDTLEGRNARREALEGYVNVEKMGKSQRMYFERQFERNLLTETDAGLLVIDPYSEMNFQLWRHKEEGWRFWIPKHAIVDHRQFEAVFQSDSYPDIESSVRDTLRVIEHIRSNNPEIPVLFLPQPLEYYPALEHREQFNDLGNMLIGELDNFYVGTKLLYADLAPTDLGTGGGPDLTLHFSGDTYYKMMQPAIETGLLTAIKKRAELLSGDNNPTAAPAVITSAAVTAAPVPSAVVNLKKNSPICSPSCVQVIDRLKISLEQYWEFSDPAFVRTKSHKYIPGVIVLDDFRDYAEYEKLVWQSGRGNRLRLIRKAEKEGFFCDRFVWKMHIPDIHQINTSKEVRSGGAMKSSYLRTVEELGGAPTKLLPFKEPPCSLHWSLPFGVFKEESGYRQGNVVVGRKLYGYIFLRRYGDVALYSLIIGHGDFLHIGIMNKLHHYVMQWLLDSGHSLTSGLKYVMYGGIDQGTAGLRDWKRREGFIGLNLSVVDSE